MHKGINTTLDEGQTPIVTTGGVFDGPLTFKVRGGCEGGGKGYLGQDEQAFTLAATQDQWLAQPLMSNDPATAICANEQRTYTNEGSVFQLRNVVAQPTAMQVRRLLPEECEKLQGFLPGYTNIPWRGKPESPDGPRYKALGNSMAVPCMIWIGKRIQMVQNITEEHSDGL